MTSLAQISPPLKGPQDSVIAFLSDPSSFPHKTDNPGMMETNQSYVFLYGRFAYKLFKAVNSGLCDNTSVEARHRNALMEIEANQALAAPLYLGVLPIVIGKDGKLRLGKPNDKRPAVDYVVRMRRFKEEDMFYARLFDNSLSRKQVFDLCYAVGEFHRAQPPATLKTTRGAAAFASNLKTTVFDRCQVLVGTSITKQQLVTLRTAAAKAIKRRQNALDTRSLQAFRIIHGDMDFSNIVFWRGQAVPFDAAVLNPQMRHNDVMRDLSYILAPLLMAGKADLVKYALEGYLASTSDNEGMKLLPLWVGYAAMVRGRSWLYRAQTATNMPPAEREALQAMGATYLEVALAAFNFELPLLP